MTKKFFLYCLLAALIVPLAGCDKKGKHKSAFILKPGDYKFTGYVDNKEPITMLISVDKSGEVKGKYSFDGSADKSDYTVRGNLFDKNKLTLYISGLDGSNDTFETWNVIGEKEKEGVVFKGTLNNTATGKIHNVAITDGDASDLQTITPPSVPVEKTEKKEKTVKKEKSNDEFDDTPPEPKKPFNDSPYPMAPGRHTLNGKADGQYPIVVYVDVASNGSISGKMGYKNILKKYGNSSEHYMYFDGYFSGNEMILTLTSSHGSVEEWNVRVSDNGSKYTISGNAYNYKKDSYFSISASGK